jgi:hypothetical protein
MKGEGLSTRSRETLGDERQQEMTCVRLNGEPTSKLGGVLAASALDSSSS